MADILHPGSYLGIIVFLILTGCGLPLPEEVAIIAAGVLSSPPDAALNPYLAFAACIFGALVGDSVMYFFGRLLGRSGLRDHPFLAAHLTPESEKKIEAMIQRHGPKVFLLVRFMVGVRAPVYVTSGVLRVPFRWFLLVDGICATIVVSVVFGLGYLFGDPIKSWIRHSEWAVTITAAVAVAVVAVVLFWKYRRKKRKRAAGAASSAQTQDDTEDHDPSSPHKTGRSSVPDEIGSRES